VAGCRGRLCKGTVEIYKATREGKRGGERCGQGLD